VTTGPPPTTPADVPSDRPDRVGPYAGGPPPRALRVVAPGLTRFGWRELVRGAEIWLALGWFVTRAVVVHGLRHPRDVIALRSDKEARRAPAWSRRSWRSARPS
jgi:hypothetical protein